MNKQTATIEFFEQVFGDDSEIESEWEGDNAFQGLLIIAKYINPMKNTIITYGAHDVMGSVDVYDLINAGITEDDVVALAKLNWIFDEEIESLKCFV